MLNTEKACSHYVSVDKKGRVIEIDEVAIHPDFERKAYHDIAVIKLKPSRGN